MKSILSLCLCVVLLGAYSYGIWEISMKYRTAYQYIEITDVEARLEDCHWRLLRANVEIRHLSEEDVVEELTQSREDSLRDEARRYKYIDSLIR